MKMLAALTVFGAVVGLTVAAMSAFAAPTFEISAHTTFDRTYTWSVAKTARNPDLVLAVGQSFDEVYDVTVTNTGSVDSNWKVQDGLHIFGFSFTPKSLTAVIQPGAIPAAVVCPPGTFGNTTSDLYCTYTAALPSGSAQTTISTMTFADDSTLVGSFAFDFTVDLLPGQPVEFNKCVDASDSFAGALGTVCLADSPKTFSYTRTIGPYPTCGSYTVENTAWLAGDPTLASARVNVTVPRVTVRTDIHNAAHAVITAASAGDVVHDKVFVARAAITPASVPDPTGTVVFHRYANLTCTGASVDEEVALAADGTAETSNFKATGDICYQAVYGGDTNYPSGTGAIEPLHVVTVVSLCVLGYPDNSSLPRSSVVFNESTVLAQYAKLGAGLGQQIALWATDEHSPLLGVETASKPVSKMTDPGNPTGGTAATGTLTATGTPAANATVKIGAQTYKLVTSLSGGGTTANEVLIGGSAASALTNLKSAINRTAGAGTKYGSLTTLNLSVSAGALTLTQLMVTANVVGVNGNNIATTETSSVLAWGATKLSGGFGGKTAHVTNPLVGDRDFSDDFKRPLYPAVFVTDITDYLDATGNCIDPLVPAGDQCRAGDWQQLTNNLNPSAVAPHDVFGSWKWSVPGLTTGISSTNDPSKNSSFGPGADPPPAPLTNLGFLTEARWDASDLGLTPGRAYRIQFMVHDGDQNKIGGDVGQACLNINYQ